VLWSQWRSLGVPAATKPAERLIDPEALIIYTAVFTDAFGDDRLRDGAISWCVEHHDLIANTRIKKLRAAIGAGRDEAFARFAHQVIRYVKRLPWTPTADAPDWTPSTDIRLPALDQNPFLLRVRCRAMFGANARAEAVAFLACVGDWAMLAAIERDTGYSRTQINDALDGLVKARWVSRSQLGNATRYGLTAHARDELTTPIVEHRHGRRRFDVIRSPAAPTWIDWQPRFELLWHVAEAAAALDANDLIGAIATLRAQEEPFRLAHMSVPAPVRPDDDPVAYEADLVQFLADAVQNLGGRGILP
jgi:hypothetical protein